jgi:hypothetical protein
MLLSAVAEYWAAAGQLGMLASATSVNPAFAIIKACSWQPAGRGYRWRMATGGRQGSAVSGKLPAVSG